MKTLKLPEGITYIGAFLSLRCNYKCEYCINRHGHLKARKELKAEQWIEGLNQLDINKKLMLPITFSGGEPSKHEGWLQIIKDLGKQFYIDILTNLDFDIDKFMAMIPPGLLQRKVPYACIRVSYHPGFSNIPILLGKIKRLQDRAYDIGLFTIDHPEMAELTREQTEKHDIDFRLKEMLGEYKGRLYGCFKYPQGLSGKARKVQCKTTELLIAPDGNIHRCHRDLYAGENKLGNLLDKDLKVEFKFRDCDKYGQCNACDVKLKNNRFQEFGTCSVEINGY